MEKFRCTLSLFSVPMCNNSSLFKFKIDFILCISKSDRDGGTKKLASPTTSSTPPTFVAITILSHAIASASTIPKPSHTELKTNKSHADSHSSILFCLPNQKYYCQLSGLSLIPSS